jgi:hypothetical protein
MTTGAYSFTDSYFFSIGIVMEDFETGDLTAFEWNTGGNAPWFVTDQDPYDGEYCARSGNINDNQHSDLTITLQTMGDGEISFFRKVSSETNYDYLRFYIDGTQMERWSGEQSWANASYPVTEGNHLLKWTYTKDQSVSEGSDCGWLDNIVFPATTTIISVEENTPENDFTVFPNPNNGSFYLNSNMLHQAEVDVYDISGRTLLHRTVQEPSGTMQIQLDDNANGLYFVRVRSNEQVVVKKVMIQ